MLRHLEENDAADRLEAAIAELIREGKSVTYDMKPSRDDPTAVGTSEVADALIEKLGARLRMSGAPEGHRRRRRERRGDVRAGARAARLRRRRAVDIKEGLPQGKALDINQMGAVLGYEPNVVGSNGYEESAGSAVVVITAGLPRGAGHEPRRPRDDEREDRRAT